MSSRSRKAQPKYQTLKEWREAQGFTLTEAAEYLGLPLTSYWNFENGNRLPRRDTLRALVSHTGVAIEFLAGVA